jgi:hypothetical protein
VTRRKQWQRKSRRREKNYAPNNTLILIWDFGIPISIVALLFATGAI